LDRVEASLAQPNWIAEVATGSADADYSPMVSTEADGRLIKEVCLMLRKLEELLCRALRGLAASERHKNSPFRRTFYALLLRAYRLRQIQDYMLRVSMELIHLDLGYPSDYPRSLPLVLPLCDNRAGQCRLAAAASITCGGAILLVKSR
ncbi:MAG: hypothetical protein K2X84_17535, partial [Beijerinckiaceae bacterium]|nr:hypothetical protein [Beijerinckiaceae bacterium]